MELGGEGLRGRHSVRSLRGNGRKEVGPVKTEKKTSPKEGPGVQYLGKSKKRKEEIAAVTTWRHRGTL